MGSDKLMGDSRHPTIDGRNDSAILFNSTIHERLHNEYFIFIDTTMESWG